MSRRSINTILMFLVFLSLNTICYAKDQQIGLWINGKPTNGKAILTDTNYTLLPAKPVVSSFKGTLDYNTKTNTAIISTPHNTKATVIVGSKNVLFDNGKKVVQVELSLAPKIINNTLYIPGKFLSDMFQSNTRIDSSKNTCIIESEMYLRQQTFSEMYNMTQDPNYKPSTGAFGWINDITSSTYNPSTASNALSIKDDYIIDQNPKYYYSTDSTKTKYSHISTMSTFSSYRIGYTEYLGSSLSFPADLEPLVKVNNTILIPLNLLESAGIAVSNDQTTLTYKGTTVKIKVGSKQAQRNNNNITLSTPPIKVPFITERTYTFVPLDIIFLFPGYSSGVEKPIFPYYWEVDFSISPQQIFINLPTTLQNKRDKWNDIIAQPPLDNLSEDDLYAFEKDIIKLFITAPEEPTLSDYEELNKIITKHNLSPSPDSDPQSTLSDMWWTAGRIYKTAIKANLPLGK